MVSFNRLFNLLVILLLLGLNSCAQTKSSQLQNSLDEYEEEQYKTSFELVDTIHTKEYIVDIYNGCAEGNVSCNNIKFITKNLLTNDSTVAYGSTKHQPCSVHEICNFVGYSWVHNDKNYEIDLINEHLIINNIQHKIINYELKNSSKNIENQKGTDYLNFHDEVQYSSKNMLNEYSKYDFSSLLSDNGQEIIGILGKDYKRLIIKVQNATKDNDKSYNISGQSQVKTNITEFKGNLKLKKIYEATRLSYGVDDEYLDKGLISQGIAIFDYKINENKTTKYSGTFYGNLYLKFYKTKDDKIHYDDINIYSDGYFNRLYAGYWKGYDNGIIKIASWADYTLPDTIAPNLNIGVGEFSPNPIYYKNGWEALKQ